MACWGRAKRKCLGSRRHTQALPHLLLLLLLLLVLLFLVLLQVVGSVPPPAPSPWVRPPRQTPSRSRLWQ